MLVSLAYCLCSRWNITLSGLELMASNADSGAVIQRIVVTVSLKDYMVELDAVIQWHVASLSGRKTVEIAYRLA